MKHLIQNKSGLLALIAELPKLVKYPAHVTIESLNRRTVEQNRAQWPILQAFAEQIKWECGGEKVHLSPEDWKDILTASFQAEHVRIAPTLDGKRLVMLGLKTREFKRRRENDEEQKYWSDWMDFLNSSANEMGVKVKYRGNYE